MTSVYNPQLFANLSSEWYLATALYDAIDDGNLREVAVLLQEKHADPNIVIPDYDITPFHLAVGHENELFAREATKLLLKNGADPNVRDNEGVTPLHVAAVWNRPTIVRILLSYGGDPMIKDDAERNAFHYAYEEHAWETLKTLEIHRRTEMKKLEDRSDKTYSVELDKVIIQGDGVQAEYRALCEGCRKDTAVPKKSVATQTSSPRVKLEEPNENADLDIFFDAETTGKIRPACYDWCEKATGVMLTDDCKRKITTHRTKSRVYEYNPIFDRQTPGDVEQRVCDFKNLYLCCAKVDLDQSQVDEIVKNIEAKKVTYTKESIEMRNVTKVTVSTSTATLKNSKEGNAAGGNYSEDSLMATDTISSKDTKESPPVKSALNDADIPYIDESSTASSPNNGDENSPTSQQEVTVEVHQADEPTVPEPDTSPKEAIKHVSWSGCLSTCACIPKKLNESESSVYFTNPESDGENKLKHETSSPLSGINEISNRTEKSEDNNADDENLISNDESEVETGALPKAPLNISVEYKYTDDEDGIEFVEARLPLCVSSSNSNASTPTRLILEKEKRTRVEEPAETSDGTAYDTDQIRTELKKLGFVSGPIAGTTKRLYLKKLRKIKRTAPNSEIPIYRPVFSSELEHVLRVDNDDWEKILTKWSCLETEIINHFSNSSLSSSWRSGTAKTSFIYLLLDPRVTNNLPARCEQMDLGEVWRDFVRAIFYIGKGTRARPYEHLHEAFLVWRETKTYPRKRYSLKIRHILEIWNEGCGVVCLQVFHNIIPAEAYTREAAMIDAIGLPSLKNEKAGIYYGVAASWNAKQKKRLGVFLLYRAMRMFIADNEVQLKPTDVR